MANAQRTVPRPPELHVKPRSYQPTQAELEEPITIDATPEEPARAVTRTVTVVEDK